LELTAGAAPRGEGALRSTPEFDLVLRLPPAQADAQRKRLEKQIEQLEKVVASSHRQLEDPEFLSRAPERVTESIRQKLAEYESQLAKSRTALEGLPSV
jgi:valyl-tRNA synthetase